MAATHTSHVHAPAPAADQRYIFRALGRFYRQAEPLSYAILRTAFGLIILTHGLPKLLGTGHGSIADPMAGATRLIETALGLPFPPQLAFLAMLLETIGAIAVAAGLLTRLFAAALFIEMVAICFVHAHAFAWIDRGFEYPLMLAVVALYVTIRGGGVWSLDERLPRQL